MNFFEVKGLAHKYNKKDENGDIIGENWALKSVDFSCAKGKIVAVLGRNGSGKSTFAKHLNALLFPDKGTLVVDGDKINSVDGQHFQTKPDSTKNENIDEMLIKIRSKVGMVFQNPDNQIVGNQVYEEVAFGPENLSLKVDEIWKRINEALKFTDIENLINRNTNQLSGGQKQRLALASVLAMRPECLVLDEATSMLDPEGAKEILDTIKRLNEEINMTVIMITHNVEELKYASYAYVMDDGEVKLQGNIESILNKADELEKYGLKTDLKHRLERDLSRRNKIGLDNKINTEKKFGEAVIEAKDISFSYKKSSESIKALENINFEIYKGETVAVVGKTGAGKSTLTQLINGLERVDTGSLKVLNIDVDKEKNLRNLRKHIGYVFQYPEYQLFEDTVLKDVMYGPKNFGMNKEESKEAAENALILLGVPEAMWKLTPYELSGGQQRKVAIAGILAYKPEILILDEPAAGLDPVSKKDLFNLIKTLKTKEKVTVIMVSHDMNDVYEMSDRVMIMNEGRIVTLASVEEVMEDEILLKENGLISPELVNFKREHLIKGTMHTYEDILEEINV